MTAIHLCCEYWNIQLNVGVCFCFAFAVFTLCALQKPATWTATKVSINKSKTLWRLCKSANRCCSKKNPIRLVSSSWRRIKSTRPFKSSDEGVSQRPTLHRLHYEWVSWVCLSGGNVKVQSKYTNTSTRSLSYEKFNDCNPISTRHTFNWPLLLFWKSIFQRFNELRRQRRLDLICKSQRLVLYICLLGVFLVLNDSWVEALATH